MKGLDILNIRKGNFSWNIDFEKAGHSTSGSMTFSGGVDFEIKKYNDNLNAKEILFGDCQIELNIKSLSDDEEIGQFKISYHVELEPTEELSAELKDGESNKEHEVKQFIMYILEPYFRYDLEMVMYDAELPKNILPYGMLHRLIR